MTSRLAVAALMLAACSSERNPPSSRPLSVAIVAPSGLRHVAGVLDVQVAAAGAPDSVQLLVDGAFLAAVPVSGAVTWDTRDAPEGPHVLLARAFRGPASADSAPVAVVVDRTAPVVIAWSPGPAAPPGWDGAIEVQLSEPLAREAFVAEGVRVEDSGAPVPLAAPATLSDDGSVVRVGVDVGAVFGDHLALQLPDLVDAAGNALAQAQLAIDLRPAELALSPPAGSTLFTNGVLALEAFPGRGAPAEVQFFGGGRWIGTAAAPPWRVVWDTRGWPEGDTVVSAVALRGALSRHASFVAVVDRTPPHVVSSTPANGEREVPRFAPVTVALSEPVRVADRAGIMRAGACAEDPPPASVAPPGTLLRADATGRTACAEELAIAPGAIVDLAGNPLVDAFALSFVRPPFRTVGTAASVGGDSSPCWFLSTAMDGRGNPITACTVTTYTAPPQVVVSRWDGSAWQRLPGVRERFGFDVAYNDAIARVLAGEGFFLFAGMSRESRPQELHGFLWNGTDWTDLGGPLQVDPTRDPNGPMTATEDADGGVWVAWMEFRSADASGGAYVRRWSGTEWGTAHELDAPDAVVPYDPRVAAGRDGTVAVAWYEWARPAGQEQHPQVYVEVLRRGSTWARLPSPAEGVTSSCQDVAVSAAGDVFVAWVEALGGGEALRAARWSGTRWERLGAALNFDPTRVVRCPRLAIDGEEQLVLARAEEDVAGASQLWLSRWDGAAWIELGGPVNLDPAKDAYDYALATQPAHPAAVGVLEVGTAGPYVRLENR